MGMIRGLLVVALFCSGVAAQAQNLRFTSRMVSSEKREALRQAYLEAFERTQSCSYLANNYSDLKTRALAAYTSGDIHFSDIAFDPDSRYECAYTTSSLYNDPHIRLRPMAYTEDCQSLTAVVFHEMLHASMPFLQTLHDFLSGGHTEEDTVTMIEHECFPEFWRRERGMPRP